VVVSIEYADLVTFAADAKKVSDNADYQAWLKGLAAVGLRCLKTFMDEY